MTLYPINDSPTVYLLSIAVSMPMLLIVNTCIHGTADPYPDLMGESVYTTMLDLSLDRVDGTLDHNRSVDGHLVVAFALMATLLYFSTDPTSTFG